MLTFTRSGATGDRTASVNSHLNNACNLDTFSPAPWAGSAYFSWSF